MLQRPPPQKQGRRGGSQPRSLSDPNPVQEEEVMKGAVVALGSPGGGLECQGQPQLPETEEAERGAWTTASRSSALRRRGEKDRESHCRF